MEASCRNCIHCNRKIPYCHGFGIVAVKLCRSYSPIPGMVLDPLPAGLEDIGLGEAEHPRAAIATAEVLVRKLATQAVEIVVKQAEDAGHVAGKADYNHDARGLTKNPYKTFTAPNRVWQRAYNLEVNADYGGIDQEIARTENAGHTFGRFDRIVEIRGQTRNPCARYTEWYAAWQEGYDYEFDLKEVKDAPVSSGLAGNGDQDGMVTTPATQA